MNLPTATELKQKLRALVTQMSDLNISRDPIKMKRLTTEHRTKQLLLNYITELAKINAATNETKQLLREHDQEIVQLAQDDLASLKTKQSSLQAKIAQLIVERDPRDERDVILEIRAGAGGDEAGLFAAELMRSYTRYAENHGWAMHIVSQTQNEQGGYKEVIAECSGHNVFGTIKFESGVHRVQRVPTTEKHGRVHTSTVTVAILPQAEEVDLTIKPENLRVDTYRASGAGGQHVNKTSSAVRITHLPTNTVVAVQEERSQYKNKAKAIKILRARLLAAKENQRTNKTASVRRQQIGTGDRSEKIRTYNYPQNRITDHRVKKSWRDIETVMHGGWDKIFVDLQQAITKL